MSWGFVNPAFLWGLLLASLPVIIHLTNRRRAIRQPFSAIHFVILSNKKLARHLKLKQFLLLLLRTLFIAFLALLLSRPYTIPESSGLADGKDKGNAARVIVIDRSASMRAEYEDKALFKQAIKKARELIAGFADSDSFAIVASPASTQGNLELTYNRSDALRFLDRLKVGWAADDLPRALEAADVMLRTATQSGKYVYLVGDFTKSGYELEALPWSGEEESPQAVLVDMRQKSLLGNLAITGIEAERSYFTGSSDWNIKIGVANFSTQKASRVPISLFINEENVANGFFDIEAGAEAQKEFVHSIGKTGSLRIEARLMKDRLSDDNFRYAALDISRTVRILVVNGESSEIDYRDEVFYLKRALDPGGLNRARIEVEIITPDQFAASSLVEQDVVFLAHLAVLKKDAAQALVEFVGGGGGLFVSVGENTDPDSYNSYLSPLLPGMLRGPKQAGEATAETPAGVTLHLAGLDYNNPLFRIFDDQNATSLYNAAIDKYYTLSPQAKPGKTVLLRYTNNAPALISVEYGKGRSMFFTSSIDRAWNDISIQPGFLPLIQEAVFYLAGFSIENLSPSILVGESLPLDKLDAQERMLASTVAGEKKRIVKTEKGYGFEGGGEPGFYLLDSGDEQKTIAVNFNTRESDLSAANPAKIEKLFGEGSTSSTLSGAVPTHRKEQTGWLSWLLILVFLSELLVIRWLD